MKFLLIAILVFFINAHSTYADDSDSLELIDKSDIKFLDGEDTELSDSELSSATKESIKQGDAVEDDLEDLKSDIGEIVFKDDKKGEEKWKKEQEEKTDETPKRVVNDQINMELSKGDKSDKKSVEIFDVGKEEKDLLGLSKYVESKIPDDEWDEIATAAKSEKYSIQEGEYLWKISQKIFGSGFYYSKIWSLNPHITNPHEVEPGMTLVFDTGSEDAMPKITVGEFAEQPRGSGAKISKEGTDTFDFAEFGEGAEPPWLLQRNKLIDQGIYFQFASEETYKDLVDIGKRNLNREYDKYDPPHTSIIIAEPGDQYDETGFDKDSKVSFDFSEGYFLNTFVTSNVVVDLGEIDALAKDNIFIQKFDTVYIKLDEDSKVRPGDRFSVYKPEGKVEHKISDRAGYRYTIVAQLEVVTRKDHLWECRVSEISTTVERGDRITAYMPKINKIRRVFSRRNIEAAIIGSYRDTANGLAYGSVVYLDRGRGDGVELGTVFEAFSFRDRGTNKKITSNPTYKIGEITVITLADNFATGLITKSLFEIPLGTIALSKTLEQAAQAARLKNQASVKNLGKMEADALDELDIELNLDEMSDDLLNKADSVKLTEDELEELERQEREKSIIKDHEKDLLELERLEGEITDAEAKLNESRVDEDKYLEQQDLNYVEKNRGIKGDGFESLTDIEKEIGLKYMDQDLNSKENPYGLTEFDLEEIDELLNTGQE